MRHRDNAIINCGEFKPCNEVFVVIVFVGGILSGTGYSSGALADLPFRASAAMRRAPSCGRRGSEDMASSVDLCPDLERQKTDEEQLISAALEQLRVRRLFRFLDKAMIAENLFKPLDTCPGCFDTEWLTTGRSD